MPVYSRGRKRCVMKIIIFADSHRNVGVMEEAVLRERPDHIIHLGDLESDASELERRFPQLPMASVPGNCDLRPVGEPRLLFELAGKRFFVTHGHLYHVKMGLESLVNAALASGADVCLFGHTHVRHFEEVEGMLLINPGSVGYNRTYGVLTVERGKASYRSRTV